MRSQFPSGSESRQTYYQPAIPTPLWAFQIHRTVNLIDDIYADSLFAPLHLDEISDIFIERFIFEYCVNISR